MNNIRYKRIQTKEALDQVLKTEPSQAQFDAYLGQLDEFIAAQLAGEEHERLFPELVAYLDTDPLLADIYSRLYKLGVDARSDKVRMAEFIPELNPSFINPLPKTLLLGCIKYVEGAIAFGFSADILGWLQVDIMQGGGALKATEAQTELYKLDPKEHGISQWPATITVLSSKNEANLCTVQVQVAPPGRAFPNLGGIKVSIEIPDVNTYEQQTDMLGVVTFDNLEIDHLSQMQVVIHE